jgi:2'-5' RNA ligase
VGLLRAFLASELPSPLQEAIRAATAVLRAKLGPELVRWVPEQNIHLTFKFLGDVSPSSLELIKDVLASEASKFEPFEALVEGFGSYPDARRPRVLWVGLTAPAVLASLQHELDAATARLGYAAEERGFSPHLTIGRVRQNVPGAELQKVRGELEQTKVGRIGSLGVDAIHLFKSDLQPTGSVYTKLYTAQLGKA